MCAGRLLIAMSVEGVCQICEAAPASHQCDRCGTLICATHFEENRGFCVECAGSMGGPGGQIQ